jgi:hypothetical protein
MIRARNPAQRNCANKKSTNALEEVVTLDSGDVVVGIILPVAPCGSGGVLFGCAECRM